MRVLMESHGDVSLNVWTCRLGHPGESKGVTRSAACCEQTAEMFKCEWLQPHGRALEHNGREWSRHVHQDTRGVSLIDDSKWVAKAISGVPPFGHSTQLRVFVDPDLLQYDEVWAAAGTWNDNFAIAPTELVRVSGGVVADLKRG